MALVARYNKILCIIEINECLVAKILLTNVTKTNEHLNVATFVHTLIHACTNETYSLANTQDLIPTLAGLYCI